jgi:hypothetical protein
MLPTDAQESVSESTSEDTFEDNLWKSDQSRQGSIIEVDSIGKQAKGAQLVGFRKDLKKCKMKSLQSERAFFCSRVLQVLHADCASNQGDGLLLGHVSVSPKQRSLIGRM